MRASRFLAITTVTVLGTTALVGSATAARTPDRAPENRSEVPADVAVATISARAQRVARAYWTRTRMARALHNSGNAREATYVAAGVAAPTNPVPRPYTNLPDRTIGKIFFRNSAGVNGSCSGAVVTSPKGDLVVTAGRCVVQNGQFFTNWTFVPAFGSSPSTPRPYGTWPARVLVARTQWITARNVRQDVGFAVLATVGGRHIQARTGAQGIAFNSAAAQNYSVFGYPSTAPYGGNTMGRCNSGLAGRDTPPGSGPRPLGVLCTMVGAVGSPWLVGLTPAGLGRVASVSTYRTSSRPNTQFGTYFGNEAKSLYDFAKTL